MTSELPPNTAAPEAADSPPKEAVVTNAPASEGSDLDIKPKMELKGVVKRIELQGAIIDVGLPKDGLLHISQLRAEPVKNVADVLKEGEEITVYVLAYDKRSGRLDLTMIKPADVTWNEVKVGQDYTGIVERIESYGVFVNIGAERPGMIHVSELAKGYVSDPREVVKLGDTIEARVIGVNKRKKQIDLSVKALDNVQTTHITEEAEDEPFVTAMELALRKALEGSGADLKSSKPQKGDRRRDKKKMHHAEREEIIARTLRMHQDKK